MAENKTTVPEQDPYKRFRVEVGNITKEEYLEAARQSIGNFFLMLAVVMVIFCGVIMLAMNDFSMAAIIGPVAVYIVVFVGYQIYIRHSYKPEMAEITMTYEFTPAMWKLEVGDSKAEVEWRGTVKLKKAKECIFLFNDDTHSNMIPRRCLSQDQYDDIINWYEKSRILAKDFIKAREAKERAEMKAQMKERRQKTRLWGTGPAWGPFKRK